MPSRSRSRLRDQGSPYVGGFTPIHNVGLSPVTIATSTHGGLIREVGVEM